MAGVRTLVLVGRVGNGKSATGNTIIGRKAFKSRVSFYGVTSECELQQTALPDGQVINVIDTPGLCDSTAGLGVVQEEILKCIHQAEDGIHAVLLVLSCNHRFTFEEEAAVHSLINLFGSEIINYMIVLFTGGDELEENCETLEEDVLCDCRPPLKDILSICGNRIVLFNNMTNDEEKRNRQLQQLLSIVNQVVDQNDGKPYTKKSAMEGGKEGEMLKAGEQVQSSSEEEQFERIAEMKIAKEPVEGCREDELLILDEQEQSSSEEEKLEHIAEMKSAKGSEKQQKVMESVEQEQSSSEEEQLEQVPEMIASSIKISAFSGRYKRD